MKTDGSELLKVDSTPVDALGNKLEPEERIAVEVMPLPVDLTLANHAVRPGTEPAIGTMRGAVETESTAGDVAINTATRCELCEHWRHEDWTRHLAAIEDTREGEKQIERLRGELLGRAVGDIEDRRAIEPEDFIRVNFSIKREFGICAAFTESTGMVTASPFYGGCPLDDSRFKMRDRESKRLASTGYDKILRLAQGQIE